jgi:7-cyano-7-deazaguanine synthase
VRVSGDSCSSTRSDDVYRDEARMSDCVAILSGGVDSSTLAYYLKNRLNLQPEFLTFDYGQRHIREIDSARKIAQGLCCDLQVISLDSIKPLIQKGSLTGDERVPEEHYSHESQKTTIVPNRNSIMLSIAVARAYTIGVQEVYYGAHFNDREIYPDCRKEFVVAFCEAMRLANDPSVNVIAPFIDFTKKQIVALGLELHVPFEDTWSCYKGNEAACGVCGTCRERLEAFQLCNAPDPIRYEIAVHGAVVP